MPLRLTVLRLTVLRLTVLSLALLWAGQVDAAPQVQEGEPTIGSGGVVLLSPSERLERATIIRDSAAAVGLTKGVLLAGIAEVETGLAHCWSEATWACQGPNSPSCAGGPVIAGSADGACSLMQGGLGMFQFDAGTYNDTVSLYGSEVLTLEGNVQAVVPFLLTRVVESVDGIASEAEALAWMNSIPIADGNADFEEWLYFVSWRYNGCKGCVAQQDKYRAGTHTLLSELGVDFWTITPPQGTCTAIPAEGAIVDDGGDCFSAQGPDGGWALEASGYRGSSLWTQASDSATPSSYAIWELRFESAGTYQLSINGGGPFAQSVQATYQIASAQGTSAVTVDQSIDGRIVLGSYDFNSGERYQVRLDDNTGEAWDAATSSITLSADALEVSPAEGQDVDNDAGPGAGKKSSQGFCSAGGSTGSSSATFFYLALLLLAWRSRARG